MSETMNDAVETESKRKVNQATGIDESVVRTAKCG
jgi:hypothetical protein